MIMVSESYLQNLEHKATTDAIAFHIIPKIFRRCVDDSLTRFESKLEADNFLHILNKQDPEIQDRLEYEDHNKSLNFFNISITNTINDKCEI